MLSKEIIDNKLIKLRKQYNENGGKIDGIQAEISDLESEVSTLEKESDTIEREIKKLEKQLIEANFKEVDNVFTGDKFRDSFIKASYFCSKDDDREALNVVEVKERQLCALDGYKGIIIDCDCIPGELQKSYIKWDVRGSFEKEVSREYIHRMDLEEIIENGKSDLYMVINHKEFMNKFFVKKIEIEDRDDIIILEHEWIEVAFNKRHLDTLLMAFEGMDIKVYYPKNSWSPMVVESSTERAILLPIKR